MGSIYHRTIPEQFSHSLRDTATFGRYISSSGGTFADTPLADRATETNDLTPETRPLQRPSDEVLVKRLRAGEEAAFVEAIRDIGPTMFRVARVYVRTDEVAEEVVQETWINVLEHLDRFEGRSSFKTWVLTILVNMSLRRGQSEARSAPFSAIARTNEAVTQDDSFELDRFFARDHPRWPQAWATVVPRMDHLPEEKLLSTETMRVVSDALSTLPKSQAAVLVLHDIEGLSSEETCEALELTDGNRRILLHRARNQIRNALERYFDDPQGTDA